MEKEEILYETETEILSFGGSGNHCFRDDYAYKIEIDGIEYPSVRHAVLSWKTEDIEVKKTISQTPMPADLKDLERSISACQSWKLKLILSKFEEYSYEKFEKSEEYSKKLLRTSNKSLRNTPMKGQSNFLIDEMLHIDNFDGMCLMGIRDYLIRKQKNP